MILFVRFTQFLDDYMKEKCNLFFHICCIFLSYGLALFDIWDRENNINDYSYSSSGIIILTGFERFDIASLDNHSALLNDL